MQITNQSAGQGNWDTGYEWKAISLLATGFALVGIDRMVISPLFPVIQKDLNLTYQDIGNISAALALAWGLTSLFVGRVSDRIGRRKVLIPAVIAYSLLGGLTGLATSVGMLLVIRALLGVAEGAYAPLSNVAAIEASHPSRRVRNLGFVLFGYTLLSMAFGPIIATQLLDFLPSWRWVFILVALPGFIVAWLLYRVLRDTQGSLATHESNPQVTAQRLPWTQILRYRNIRLNLVAVFCMMTCLFVVAAMMPNYLTDHVKLSVQQMGFVMSGFGFGACAGYLFMPALSDRFGRKPTVLAGFLGTLISLWMLLQSGEPAQLFFWMFVVACFVAAMSSNLVAPITVESVPASLSGTAAGVVNGVGEIVGGALAPVGAGFVADHYGIQQAFTVALIASGLGFLISLFFIETAPSRTRLKSGVEARQAELMAREEP